MGLELSTRHIQYYIIQRPSTALTVTLTGHALMATLLEYIASERSAALKRKMFGVSDGGELGHFNTINFGQDLDRSIPRHNIFL